MKKAQTVRRMESIMHDTLEPSKKPSWRFPAYRLGLTLFIVNVIGTIVYLFAASFSWAIPQERELGLHSTTGEPFTWAIAVFPIYAFFALLNLAWGAYICFKKRWRSGYFWLMTAAVWLIAVWIDFAHH
ncbi:MAG: hypothetical protein ABSA27_08575 [Terriglobales bacterium]